MHFGSHKLQSCFTEKSSEFRSPLLDNWWLVPYTVIDIFSHWIFTLCRLFISSALGLVQQRPISLFQQNFNKLPSDELGHRRHGSCNIFCPKTPPRAHFQTPRGGGRDVSMQTAHGRKFGLGWRHCLDSHSDCDSNWTLLYRGISSWKQKQAH